MGSFVVLPRRVSKVIFQTNFGRKTHMLKLEILLSHLASIFCSYVDVRASSLLFRWVRSQTVSVSVGFDGWETRQCLCRSVLFSACAVHTPASQSCVCAQTANCLMPVD